MSQESGTNSYLTSYVYSEEGEDGLYRSLVTQTAANGAVETADVAGNPVSVSDQGTGETAAIVTTTSYDAAGNVLVAMQSSGSKTAYTYDDFGNVTESKADGYGSFDNELQYTGAIYDDTTGLLYLNARYYEPRTGRFISRDTYRGERNNADTWHLYLYCANNPINYVDPSGHLAFVPFLIKGGIILGGIWLTYYTTTKEFQDAWGRATRGLEKKLKGLSESAKSWAKQLTKDIGTSFSKAKRRYNGQTETHHIVARKDWRAAPARKILQKVKIELGDAKNLVEIKKGLHKRLHRKSFYNMVNLAMDSAYKKSSSFKNNKKKVTATLRSLKSYIEGLNKVAPF